MVMTVHVACILRFTAETIVSLCLIMQMNISIMLLNLLIPAYPLPGGRIFADILRIAGVPANTAAKIMVVVGLVIGIGLVIVGALRVWLGLTGVIVGVFILFSTYQLWRSLEQNQVEQHPLYVNRKEGQGTSMYTYNVN
jgi:Zn-dependent protease